MKYQLIFLLLIILTTACKKDVAPPAKVISTKLKACFGTYLSRQNDGEVLFENCSENATHYLWNFGDGKTSTEKEPIHNFEGTFPFIVTLIAYNENEADTLSKRIYDEVLVYKPNVYIYPLHPTDLCVTLSFPMGGEVVQSIPDYSKGWCVNVKPSGRINDSYNYLFYESRQPNLFQYTKGWCIPQRDLESFFKSNMKEYNFSTQEISDFIVYWMPLLKENDYYCIYPQTNEIINKTIQLGFSIQPDHIYRLFYGVIGVDQPKEIEAPAITPFVRSGFYVVEWGVFRK